MEQRISKLESEEQVVEYRLTVLEKNFGELNASMKIVADTVSRWDARLSASGGDFMQCPIHKLRMEEFDKRLVIVENEIGKLKTLAYKMAGGLIVVSILLQIVVAPMIQNWVDKGANIVQQESHEHVVTNPTNGVPYIIKH